jgi:hypothetical protein
MKLRAFHPLPAGQVLTRVQVEEHGSCACCQRPFWGETEKLEVEGKALCLSCYRTAVKMGEVRVG